MLYSYSEFHHFISNVFKADKMIHKQKGVGSKCQADNLKQLTHQRSRFNKILILASCNPDSYFKFQKYPSSVDLCCPKTRHNEILDPLGVEKSTDPVSNEQ